MSLSHSRPLRPPPPLSLFTMGLRRYRCSSLENVSIYRFFSISVRTVRFLLMMHLVEYTRMLCLSFRLAAQWFCTPTLRSWRTEVSFIIK